MASKKIARGCSGQEKCIMNCLPRELMEEVFLRLPVSCLLQCVGVCKMWRGIIRDSKFAAAHLQHAPSCTLLFSPQGSMRSSGNLYPSDAIFFDEAWSPSTWAVPVIGPDDVVCGSCNGLLCLYMPTSMIKIANPTTGEYLHLQKPVKGLRDDHFSFYRFGYHPATKEYKVIHFFHDSGTYTGGSFNVIQVYTLGDDEWKEVITSKDLSLNCVENSGVVIVDGTVYWLNEELGTNWQHVVMSFDLDDESFAQIQLPEVDLEHYIFGSFRHYWITEIDSKVCVSTAPCISNVDYRIFFGKVQVWALDTAIDQRWSQKYSIQLRSPFNLGLHFVHGNKIMIQSWDNNLYSYELLQKNFEIEPSKVVKLLDLSPRGEYGMQSYVSLMSLVRLDVYARAAIVRRPLRLRGWKLKKWKVWENEFSVMDKLWKSIHRLEHEVQETRQLLTRILKDALEHSPGEVIWQRISLEIDQIFQCLRDFPADQHPKAIRRPNWVGKMRVLEALKIRVHGLKDIVELRCWNVINRHVVSASNKLISVMDDGFVGIRLIDDGFVTIRLGNLACHFSFLSLATFFSFLVSGGSIDSCLWLVN